VIRRRLFVPFCEKSPPISLPDLNQEPFVQLNPVATDAKSSPFRHFIFGRFFGLTVGLVETSLRPAPAAALKPVRAILQTLD
jgi:hypothetical protein